MPHSHPYKVTWLNKGQHVLVNEQVWVEFAIGKYYDRILCDVLPMDACHLLLGRLWQFDRKAIHDGEKNSYAFTKEGVTYRIQSLIEDEGTRTSGPNVLLAGGKEFLGDLKKGDGEHYALLVKPSQEEKTKQEVLPTEVQQLLDQFKDIASDGTPARLPPPRIVSHQINFIPGASFPNKATYKMTREQNK